MVISLSSKFLALVVNLMSKLKQQLYVVVSLAALVLTGCSSMNPFPEELPAQLSEPTASHQELLGLPAPLGRIPVSVYAFRDQTGQYKPQDNVSSFSTAVTQGATSILMQALSDSGWFVPVEREGLQNILTERKIIRAADQGNNKDKELPPLTTAKILLEGGIISYDTNTRTGGTGLGYFGITASETFREDQISVYLRAIDVRSGQVLLSVSTTKRVLSQELRAGLFRYVSLKRLAEAEIGYTNNEPMQLCVVEAIEKSLSALIVKGIDQGIWKAQNS